MTPAFQSLGQVLRFGAVLLILLILPLLMALVGPPGRIEVYRAVPHGAGPFVFIAHEIFEESSDIDILIDADSLLWVGIDAPYLQKQLTTALGRPATVVVLAANWPGMDQRYVLLRDLLTRRKVAMVVLSPPRPGIERDGPHIQAFRWLQFGADPAITDGLSLKHRLAIYAAEVLGAPRQLLSDVRSNQVLGDDGVVKGLGSRQVEQGFHNAPFVPVKSVVAPVIRADDMILSPDTAGSFQVTGPSVSPYQLHFMREIGRLLRERGIPLVVVHVPLAKERGSDMVSEQADWSDAFGVHATVIGLPSQRLFGNMSDAEFYRYYYDDHLNRNGSELFTQAVSSAIIKVYLAGRSLAEEH